MSMNALKKISLAFFLLLCFSLQSIHAQAQQRFKAGLLFGLNASQIRGDESAGYNKLGLHGGLRAVAVLKERMDLSIELLYAQRGSYLKGGISTAGDLKINLQYAEVPVLFTYKDWLHEEDNYYKIQASGGFSYGRLLSVKAEGSFHDEETEHFNTNDISFTIGAEYFTNRHFSIGARWTTSLNLLYNHKHNVNLDSLRGYFLSFRGAYIF